MTDEQSHTPIYSNPEVQANRDAAAIVTKLTNEAFLLLVTEPLFLWNRGMFNSPLIGYRHRQEGMTEL